jgi:hypothetical protein
MRCVAFLYYNIALKVCLQNPKHSSHTNHLDKENLLLALKWSGRGLDIRAMTILNRSVIIE